MMPKANDVPQVLEFAMATTQKDQHEIDAAMDNIRGQLNKLRSEIKAAPALESLKETQVEKGWK